MELNYDFQDRVTQLVREAEQNTVTKVITQILGREPEPSDLKKVVRIVEKSALNGYAIAFDGLIYGTVSYFTGRDPMVTLGVSFTPCAPHPIPNYEFPKKEERRRCYSPPPFSGKNLY